ncbi:hypothetical protein GCM10027347_44880 [Larkinella harenae]
MANIKDFGIVTIDEICNLAEGAPEQTKELGRTGDPRTLEQFLKHRDSIRHIQLQNATSTAYDYSGDYVDVDRYLCGDPECMVNFNSYDAPRFIEIEVMTGRPWWTPNRIVFDYFNYVLDLIDKIESEGCRCQINITGHYMLNSRDSHQIKYALPYKSYGEPLNMSQLAGLLLNNDFFTNVTVPALGFGDYYNFDYRLVAGCPELIQTDEKITIPSLYWFLASQDTKREFFANWTPQYVHNKRFYPVFTKSFIYREWGLSHLLSE